MHSNESKQIVRRFLQAAPVLSACFAALSLLVGAGQTPAAETAEDEFAPQPTWSVPSAAAVRADVFHWLESRKVEPAQRDQIAKDLWPTPAQPPRPRTARSRRPYDRPRRIDASSREIVDLCSKPRADLSAKIPQFPWLTDKKDPGYAKTPPLVRNNLRLWYGRWLAQERLFDESLDQLAGLQPADVADPATLLFYQGVDYNWLLKKEPGLQAIGKLLEQKNHIPRRYAEMAELLKTDLAALKPDSLDDIARRMRDNRRHLDLGRAGKKVRGIEDGIIASLDKLIEEKEKEQEARMAAEASGGGTIRSTSPAQDSVPLGGKGPGEVTKKPIGNHSGWGDLPAKQREEALQSIGQEFPSHFRDVIEHYFKRLAGDSAGGEGAAPEDKKP